METTHTCDVALAGDLNKLIFPASYIEAHRSLGLETAIISGVSSSSLGLGGLWRNDKGGDVRYIDAAAPALEPVSARLLILIWPGTGVPVPVIAPRAVVLVTGGGDALTAESVAQCEHMLSPTGATAVWAPQTDAARARLRELFGTQIDISSENWHPVADPEDWPDPFARGQEPKPIIGVLALSDKSCNPEYRTAIQTLAQNRKMMLRCLCDKLEAVKEWGITHPRVAVFTRGEISPTRFVNSIHFFNALPSGEDREAFQPFIGLALARGAVVFLRPDIAKEFGHAVVPADPNEIADLVEEFVADRDRYVSQAETARRYAAEHYGRKAYLARLRPLLEGARCGASRRPRSKSEGNHSRNRSTVLFVSSNGVGLGHLVRLMAIARRCSKHVTPVFVTMTQSIDKVVEEGWYCEYLNSPGRIAGPYRSWNAYFRQELEGIVAYHRPNLLVYDGNRLPPGLLDLVGSRPDIGLVWVRRAMWGHWSEAQALQDISAQKSCDLVIEPQELAEEQDFGATVTSFDRVPEPMNFARVPPITYLDAHEALSREDARRELGITEPTAVLIAFGAGAVSDQYETVERVISALKRLEGLQVVVARHILSDDRGSLWHGVDTPQLFPMGRFLGAFDAVISAAGYNTFHEVVQTDVPTLFIPVEAEQMDRQLDRAQWAESRGLASVLRQQDLDQLPRAVADLLNGKRLKRRGKRLKRPGKRLKRPGKRRKRPEEHRPAPNGAARAAALVGDLAARYAQWPTERTDSAGLCGAMVAVEG